ncbi:hypothetical protein NITHO_460028 [Nitrolancea hollandica Lb]|uniref:Uncharacterized protein n=1 Tax=Nitrolancea hollandica Lb TaxID=1129897 RepID=I4EKI0_9BACT|nr:hypothetical protein NITHO_460028 [Nitrolancea hollandica Lb]
MEDNHGLAISGAICCQTRLAFLGSAKELATPSSFFHELEPTMLPLAPPRRGWQITAR